MRVETELEGCAMHETARENTVERRPSGERALQQRSVCDCLFRRDERLSAPGRAQHCGVDARRRSEAGARHPADEAQLVPRSPGAAEQGRRPDGGPFRGQPPLHDRVELRQPHSRVAEQTAEDRRARGEGQVCHDRERLPGQWKQRRVARNHLDARIGSEARLELSQCGRVELDRTHAGARVGKSARQRTAARAEV